MSNILEEFRKRKQQAEREAAQPLVARLAELTTSINKKEMEIKTERAERSEIMTELRRIDPELAPRLYANRKNGRKKDSHKRETIGISDERVAAFTAWLHENRDWLNEMNEGKGFTGTNLWKDDRFTLVPSQSQIAKVLRHFRDDDIVRTAHIGGMGHATFYKVI